MALRTLMVPLLCTLACKQRRPDPAPAPPDESASDAVPYDCSAIAIDDASTCAASPVWIGTLERAGPAFLYPKSSLSADVCAEVHAALDAALDTNRASLTAVERVVGQNAALRVYGPRTCEEDVRKKVTEVVSHLALPAEEIPRGTWPELEAWLGQTWMERKAESVLFHDVTEWDTRSFRPVRSEAGLAIFSELLAVDRAGGVHLTPIVGRIETRESAALDAPACIGKLDPARLRCPRGRLRPVPIEKLEVNMFVPSIEDGAVGCNRCHEDGPKTKDASKEELESRRAAFLDRAEEMVRRLR